MSGMSYGARFTGLQNDTSARLHAAEEKIRRLEGLLDEHEQREAKKAQLLIEYFLLTVGSDARLAGRHVDATASPDPKPETKPSTLESWPHYHRPPWTPAEAVRLLDWVVTAAAPCQGTFTGAGEQGRSSRECYHVWKQHLEPLLKKTLSELS